jgi:hypothetical protein
MVLSLNAATPEYVVLEETIYLVKSTMRSMKAASSPTLLTITKAVY